MKWLIASDLHGSGECCEKLMDAYRREGAERLVLLGDILYYGRGPTQKEAVADMLNTLSDRIICVRGNCDSDRDMTMLAFPVLPRYVKLPVAGRGVFATHGHLYNEAVPPAEMRPGDVLLQGHTHVPDVRVRNKRICFNPGSVARPLENSVRGYMTMEDGLFKWFTLEGEEYRTFDVNTYLLV